MSDLAEIHKAIASRIRCAAQLWSCDPDDCPLCDCNMNDEQRQQLHDLAESDALEIVSMIVKGEQT